MVLANDEAEGRVVGLQFREFNEQMGFIAGLVVVVIVAEIFSELVADETVCFDDHALHGEFLEDLYFLLRKKI